jgi:TLP18.3/Psb32/MOLO-1 phosphatase superfamily protein
MSSATTRAQRALVVGLVVLLGVGAWVSRHYGKPHRPRYVLINETGQHDYDLAFKMSLKLAERKSGIENALVLMAALPQSKSIEEAAAELFTRLQIGARRHGRGILYLYSAKENLLKIEVSYALEGDIPDLYCRRLQEAAKTYMLSEVPQDFISELIITTNLRGAGAVRTAGRGSAPNWLSSDFLSGGGGALVHGYSKTLADYAGAIRRLPQVELKEYLPAPDAGVSVERYLSSLAAGIGDPRLPLLTEGSRLFRAVVPRDEAQQERVGEFFRAAAPHRLLFAGDLALAVPQPNHSNLPLVLRRGADSLWYVDEAKSWTYFHRFEDNVNFFVKYSDNPFLVALRALNAPNMDRAIYGAHTGTPAVPAYPFSLASAIQGQEDKIRDSPLSAANHAALGDLYLFEANWLSKAIASYEQASALAPEDLGYRWRLMDLYLNASLVDKMLAELQYLARHLPADRQTQEWYRYYKQEYDFGGD